MTRFPEDLETHVRAYRNTAEHNDGVHAEFTAAASADPLLSEHRRHIEQNKLGYGDPAFHAMSLWALLAKAHGWQVRVHAVTPLEGQALGGSRWWRSLKFRLLPRYRERIRSGDFYPDDDYEAIVRKLFAHFGLDFSDVRLVRGYSNDPAVLAQLQGDRFQIIYIDGDHTFEGAAGDVRQFAQKVVTGGWLVMDDAAFDLPGTKFWKGYETVSRACALLPGLGFKNVLNVGHNRVFEMTR
jgi:Methyltransferase domain